MTYLWSSGPALADRARGSRAALKKPLHKPPLIQGGRSYLGLPAAPRAGGRCKAMASFGRGRSGWMRDQTLHGLGPRHEHKEGLSPVCRGSTAHLAGVPLPGQSALAKLDAIQPKEFREPMPRAVRWSRLQSDEDSCAPHHSDTSVNWPSC